MGPDDRLRGQAYRHVPFERASPGGPPGGIGQARAWGVAVTGQQPMLVINPIADPAFVRACNQAMRARPSRPDELQSMLARGLSRGGRAAALPVRRDLHHLVRVSRGALGIIRMTPPGGRMDDVAEDLRATTESIAHDAQRLRDLELEKATLDVDDPRLQDLSEEGRRLGERLARTTRAEEQLARLAADEGDAGPRSSIRMTRAPGAPTSAGDAS